MPPPLSSLARCRPPATGQDTHARRNLPTATPAGSTSFVPASTPFANPPALAVPTSPQQQLTRSSVATTLGSEEAGGQGPPTARGCVPALRHATKPMLTRWRGRRGGWGARQPKLWPLLGTAAPGDSVAGARKAALGCAGSSHSIYPRLRWRHRPPQWQVFAPRHPSSTARGTVLGSGATLGASNPGSTLVLPAQSRRRSPCTSWAISQSLVSGGGQDTASSTAHQADTLQGSEQQLRGGGGLPDLPGELWGRRVSAFPQGNHQRKTL